jgi:uncharacterized membrane protein YjjB (DUF3815 family)
MELLLSYLGSLFPSILFNVNKKKIIWVGFAGMIGWLFYSQFYEATGRTTLSIFLGALSVGIYSELMARALKTPATVFSVSGIFPLVPGIAAYSTTQYIIEKQLYDAINKLIETLAGASAIAIGLMLATAIFSIPKRIKKL